MQNVAPAVRGQKSKLTYRHAELGSVKVRKVRMFRPAHCSLYLHYSQERKQKTYFIFFFFFSTETITQSLRSSLDKMLMYRDQVTLMVVIP